MAAQKLYVSPSKLSKEITWLEGELKTKLIHRSTRQLTLSEEGQLLYTKAKWLLDEITEMKNQIHQRSSEPEGLIRFYIATNTIAWSINSLLFYFMEKYPKIQLQIVTGGDLFLNLNDMNFDLALMLDEINHSNFICRPFPGGERSVFGAPSYFKKNGIPKTIQDLLQHNCLINTHLSIKNNWELGKNTMKVSGNLSSSDFETLKQAAIAGVGLLYASPFTITQALEEKKLCGVLTPLRSRPINVFAVYPRRLERSKNIQLLIDFLATEGKKISALPRFKNFPAA